MNDYQKESFRPAVRDTAVIELTRQEIDALQVLLHRALLHSGMEVASAAVVLSQKFAAAAATIPPPPAPPA